MKSSYVRITSLFDNKQKPVFSITILLLNKKKTDRVEDDFTYNVVLHPDKLTLFCKKKFNGPIFTNLNSNEPQNTKMPIIFDHSKFLSWT